MTTPTPDPRVEIREVLAAAYPRVTDDRQMLTHAVEVDEKRRVLRVLCNRVKLDNLADPGSFASPTAAQQDPPTCKRCLPQWNKRRYSRGGDQT